MVGKVSAKRARQRGKLDGSGRRGYGHLMGGGRLGGALVLCLTSAMALGETSQGWVDHYGADIFVRSRAVGMVLVAVVDGKVLQRFYGETRLGGRTPPDENSLLRIASVGKLMTSEVMVALAAESKVVLDEPLWRYAPSGWPHPAARPAMTLRALATHTGGVPRELPGPRPEHTPVFVWPNQAQRWHWLGRAPALRQPGWGAAYSNLGYDLLADALSTAAGKPYAWLLREKVTGPLGMRDTTLSPGVGQCARLMQPSVAASPCVDTQAAGGSGGVYSTARDMGRWLQDQMAPATSTRRAMVEGVRRLYVPRAALREVVGMDVAGRADALGLGWVYMEGQPGVFQKTGGGGGFIGYVAMVPDRGVAVWVGMTRSPGTRFRAMSDGVNALVGRLADTARLVFQPDEMVNRDRG